MSEELILKKMDEAVEKAYASLAGYKFWMFGYHASSWVKYNQLLPASQKRQNPFKDLVKAARETRETQIPSPDQARLCNSDEEGV